MEEYQRGYDAGLAAGRIQTIDDIAETIARPTHTQPCTCDSCALVVRMISKIIVDLAREQADRGDVQAMLWLNCQGWRTGLPGVCLDFASFVNDGC